MSLGFNSEVIIIETLPVLMHPSDMVVYTLFILEIPITVRAIIIFSRTKMDFLHVSPHMLGALHTVSTNHADKATVT